MNALGKAVAGAIVVAGLGAGNVSAAPFSYAATYNDIFNWSITDGQGNPIPVLGPIYTSEAHAELQGALVSTGGIGMDAPIANLGTAANPNNSFIKIDRNNPDYSWGDAVIWNPSHATNMGEVYLEGGG